MKDLNKEISLIPVSAVIATANRKKVLEETLLSLLDQNLYPDEILIIDASDDTETESLCAIINDTYPFSVKYHKAPAKGAATQRNHGVSLAQNRYIFFFDDDVIFYPNCIEKLWLGIQDKSVGGVNALIVNQQYHKPSIFSEFFYRTLNGKKEVSYAGKCFGPAFNLLPECATNAVEFVEVEWLNTTCTLYKKEALPEPVFSTHFTGYSFMEDLALSLTVAKSWKLLNAPSAQIFHNSQPSLEKSSVKTIAEMELVNRYYIMKHVLNQKLNFSDISRLFIQQAVSAVTSRQVLMLPFWQGKLNGLRKIKNI
jgi:glycosyltransferase involved in cell wall biosynthesis